MAGEDCLDRHPHPQAEFEFLNSNFTFTTQGLRPRGRSRRSSPGNNRSALLGDRCDCWRPRIASIALRHPPLGAEFSNSNSILTTQRLRPRGRSRRSSPDSACSSLPGGLCDCWGAKIVSIALRHPPLGFEFSNSISILTTQPLRPRGRSRRSLPGNTCNSLYRELCDCWGAKIASIALWNPLGGFEFSNSKIHPTRPPSPAN